MKKLDLTDWQAYDFSRTGCDVCVIRYGAFGDTIQASSVFPALKEQGHTVCFNTTERGYNIVKNNPYLDAVLVQKKDQVPNEKLDDYWNRMESHFKKVVNLSETVERSLLCLKESRPVEWNTAFRDLVMSVDYLEGTHAVAGVQGYPYRPFFYPSNHEDKWAKQFRAELGGKNKVILYALSGSSLHKVWPHMDKIFARLMVSYDNVKIVTVGDNLCKILEYPWENESRVIRRSGKWSIRQTLSFVPYADMVIGPETGVMNAASFLDMPKILILSHSSPKNIGGNWKNTTCLIPDGCECYPCHMLHYSWKSCNRNDLSGVADCAQKVDPDKMWGAIRRYFNE